MKVRAVRNSLHPRVGYVLKRFPRLSETFVCNELRALERQGLDVVVFSLMKPSEELQHELVGGIRAQVIYLPKHSVVQALKIKKGDAVGRLESLWISDCLNSHGASFEALFSGKSVDEGCHRQMQGTALAMLASAMGIGHLHAHFGTDATTVALLASRLSRIPYSFTAHAKDIFHTYVNELEDTRMRRQKLAEASFVVTVSDYNRSYLRQLAGITARDKIRRLYNGIDLNRFRPTDRDRPSNCFLSVGRLIEKKGFTHLVEACRHLREAGRSFRCIIVGDGPDRELLERQIEVAGLSAHVQLTGPQTQEQLVECMQGCTAMVLSSVISASGDRDGLPTVLLEALGMGLPAISTSVAGIPEIIEGGKSGLLVPPGNPAALAAAMARIIDEPLLASRLGAGGRAKAERDFDLDKNVATLRGWFEEAMAIRARSRTGEDHANRISVSG